MKTYCQLPTSSHSVGAVTPRKYCANHANTNVHELDSNTFSSFYTAPLFRAGLHPYCPELRIPNITGAISPISHLVKVVSTGKSGVFLPPFFLSSSQDRVNWIQQASDYFLADEHPRQAGWLSVFLLKSPWIPASCLAPQTPVKLWWLHVHT